MKETVLVVDDDRAIRQLVRLRLEEAEFEVEEATSGEDALTRVLSTPVDLILLDVVMPQLDGLTTLRRLRMSPAGANIPIILVTGKAELDDRLQGLELGADDFISKPFEVEELVARVRTVLRRSQQMRDVSPLTGLPGNFRIAAELEARVKSGEPFSLVHADLDNFKAFNDHYGFMRGDQVITFCARSMLDAAAETGDASAFVGHIGGDDFVALMSPDVAESFCRNAIRGFDAGVLAFYDTVDAIKGYIEVTDRRGERHAYPIVSVSMGIASNQQRQIETHWEASAIAVELKEFAKQRPGSSYEVDRRTT